ncbi:unnamed protein product [Lactuca saligna]|uniref:Uncharacterized protein n=1 Tax=Lactuca saligna TaxID=75948 RepID=A0AA36EPP5_LACSI|nr:unnamed protein product [Lactuca saligna]
MKNAFGIEWKSADSRLICYDDDVWEDWVKISRKVLVNRNPGLHFGDIHVLNARYVKELEDFIGNEILVEAIDNGGGCRNDVQENRYFREDYNQEINWHNPLGMVGELALAFGELLRMLWALGRTPFSPRQFKAKLARFAP